MEKSLNIWTVDAFADRIFTGNPAAVIPLKQFPSDELCQKIAFELNLSETAFVECDAGKPLRIRWFTPKVEVKLCGHATLSAAHILFEENFITGDHLEFQSLTGPLKVKKTEDKLTLDFPLQETGPVLASEPFQRVVGSDLLCASQASDDLIIELNDESAVRGLDIPPRVWSQFDSRGVIVTARGSGEFDFISRFFAPRLGIDEDPVTGATHCKLAHYWKAKLGKNKFRAYQASKRGGVLELEVIGERVLISGKAITVLKGTLKLE
jgi:PhzF family phenazine biosynthesis protein